jgi:epoxyqueuosine reductase
LGNSGNPAAIAPLARALASDPESLVRAHAAWALGRFTEADARGSLAHARQHEPDAVVREEIEAALALLEPRPANGIIVN